MSNELLARPEIIIVARESRGLTQKELAQLISISPAQLSRIEVGLRSIQKDQLAQIADVLHYPVEFFRRQQPIYGPGVTEVFHRRRQNVPDRLLNKVYAQILLRTTEISQLIKEVDIGPVAIRSTDVDDFGGNAAEVARIVRAGWHVPKGPIRNLVEVVEDARGIVVPFDFGTGRIDAVSQWVNGMPPMFFLNAFSPTDRLRFTLCHELGHLIMHSTANPDMERQADEFAAEFLMPALEIRPYLSDLSLPKLADLKRYWKVSMAALLKRASDLGAITLRRARTLWAELGKAGYKMREPLDIPPETPTLLKEIVDTYFEEYDYTVADLAKMLCLSKNETVDIYIHQEQQLAVIEQKAAIKEAERIIRTRRNS